MDEIYRMLGREHQADLEREALKFRRAAAVRRSGRDHIGSRVPWRRWTTKRFVRARLISFVVRIVRASSLSALLVLALLPFVAAGCGSGGTAKASKVADDTANVVRATERERLRALLGHDLDAARKLHADDFELINPLGEVVSKEAYLDSGAAFAYTVWKPMSPISGRWQVVWSQTTAAP